MQGKNILVTGAAGFIGSHIVEYLLQHGAKLVRAVDNLASGVNNISHLIGHSGLEFMEGDITDYEFCLKVTSLVDVICHQAAVASVVRSMQYPEATHNANVNGFVNILNAARVNGVKRVIYTSSSSVYGDNDDSEKIESNIGNALSPYALSKYVNELYAGLYTRIYGLECIGLKYFNVFGPLQRADGPYSAVIPQFINKLSKNDQVTINGDGSISRDFTHVDNVVSANVKAMTTTNLACYGQVFNIALGESISILELHNLIAEMLCVSATPIFGPPREGDIQHSKANITKARELLDWTPHVSFKEGLQRTINSYL